MCNDVGVTPQASFILGLPGETLQTLQQTVAFAGQLKDMGVLHGYHLLAPFPGTDVRENCQAYDIQIMSNDWNDYHANQAIVRTSAVDQHTLMASSRIGRTILTYGSMTSSSAAKAVTPPRKKPGPLPIWKISS